MIRTSRLPLHRPGYGTLAVMRNLLVMLALLAACSTPTGATAELRILAFGDSLVHGYGLPADQGFVPRLQAWLADNDASDIAVINAGVSGDTTAGGLARIDWALAEDVDAVIVVLGGNDMLRGLDPGEVRSNLGGVLTAISAAGLPVLLVGLPPVQNYGEAYASEFRAAYRAVAAEHGAILYPSFFAGMGDGRSPAEVMALMQPDGIHPNAEGVELIVAGIGPTVLELVEMVQARR